MINRIPYQVTEMERLIGRFNSDCFENLRMDRNTFGRLCLLLRDVGGLSTGKYISVEEQVTMFLLVLAHHKKIGWSSLSFIGQVKPCHITSTVYLVLSCNYT